MFGTFFLFHFCNSGMGGKAFIHSQAFLTLTPHNALSTIVRATAEMPIIATIYHLRIKIFHQSTKAAFFHIYELPKPIKKFWYVALKCFMAS